MYYFFSFSPAKVHFNKYQFLSLWNVLSHFIIVMSFTNEHHQPLVILTHLPHHASSASLFNRLESSISWLINALILRSLSVFHISTALTTTFLLQKHCLQNLIHLSFTVTSKSYLHNKEPSLLNRTVTSCLVLVSEVIF